MNGKTVRTRTQGPVSSTETATLVRTYGDAPGEERAAPTVGDYTVKYETAEMRDVVTDKFFTRRNQGEILNNDATRSSEVVETPLTPWYNQLVFSDGYTRGYTNNGTRDPWDLLIVPGSQARLNWLGDESGFTAGGEWGRRNARDRALIEAKQRLNSSKVDSLEAIAEGRESLRMISALLKGVVPYAKTAGKLTGFLQKYLRYKKLARWSSSAVKRKFYAQKAWDTFGKGSNMWLTWRYGIRPIIQDIEGAIRTFQSDYMPRHRVSGEATHAWDDSDETEWPAYWVNTDVSIRRTVSIEYEARAGFLYEVATKAAQVFRDLGGNNWLELPWDLVPYSFVIDRFCDIGGWLRSLTPSVGCEVKAGWSYFREVTTDSIAFSCKANAGWVNGTFQSHPGTYVVSCSNSLKREKALWMRVARVTQPTLPTFQFNLDWKGITDIVALIRQRFKTGKLLK